MRRGRAWGLVLVWALVVAGVSWLAWFAIDRAGRQVLAGPGVGLDAAVASGSGATGPSTATRTSTPTSTPTPSSTVSGTRSPRTGSPASFADRTAQVRGGTLAVRCTGSTARLRYATPSSGWTVSVDQNGPDEVEIDFSRSGERVRATGVCVKGAPVITSETRTSGGGDDGGGSGGDDGGGSGGSGGHGSDD